jgi:NitT/TauT family transport system substrate-binding protein
MKSVLSAYLETLYDANPASIGGSMPADGFYYVEK